MQTIELGERIIRHLRRIDLDFYFALYSLFLCVSVIHTIAVAFRHNLKGSSDVFLATGVRVVAGQWALGLDVAHHLELGWLEAEHVGLADW